MNALSYHERSKHRLDRYAAGPETLDWSMQPNPFREFAGTKRTILPLSAHEISSLLMHPPSIESVGALLQLSMGLSAWKESGPDKWALRCNPSSGNLHPTECYVLPLNVPGLENGLHHYRSIDHSLELRCSVEWSGETRIFLGLTSIHWREAWKYGERAFRYCQLDIGHALGALRYAAGVVGWGMKLIDAPEGLLGTNRLEDFFGAEPEEADGVIEVDFGNGIGAGFPELAMVKWSGKANRLDAYPMYSWPVIDEVAFATRKQFPLPEKKSSHPAFACHSVELILGRRSAQQFDPAFMMKKEDFFLMLDKLHAENSALRDIWDFEPRLHPVFFVHRIEGMEPGLYILPRSDQAQKALKAHLRDDFLWEKTGAHYLLARSDCRTVAKTISCRQAIASNSCFSLGMLAEFGETVQSDPWRYRQLHWEAGLMGHVLYLEAEAAGLRGTGIGCFFDDAFHDLLGLSGTTFQSLYHFTVGMPILDSRILTLPPYPKNRGE